MKTFDKQKNLYEYRKERYDIISIALTKESGMKDKIVTLAKERRMTITKLILEAIKEYCYNHYLDI